jgi:hypothetical protein
MIKLINILKEISYSFSEYEADYTEDDNSLLAVEYIFKTKENKYKVKLNSSEKAREFAVSFGIDVGDFHQLDTFQMTGEGDAKNILETVSKIINEFYYQYEEEIDKITISGTSEKRSRIYKFLLPKYIDPEVMNIIEIK